jgi:hypothetical protein
MNLIPRPERLVDFKWMESGDRMKQAEFHRLYENYPKEIKLELIGGMVFMASPSRRQHGLFDSELGLILGYYRVGTPGVEMLPNTTAILGEESEPQPDLSLRIDEDCGGLSKVSEDDYVVGPPEFVAEIAYSTRAIDLHLKYQDYQKAGVLEYLVVCVEPQEIHWFQLPNEKELKPDKSGIYKSKVLPGLWIDGAALLAKDPAKLIAVIQDGLAGKEHAAFVRRLERTRLRGSR